MSSPSHDPEQALLEEFRKYAEGLSLVTHIDELEDDSRHILMRWLRVDFKNGRQTRPINLDPSGIAALQGKPLNQYVFLGDYNAFLDRSTDIIEARIASQVGQNAWREPSLAQIPGIEMLEEEGESDGEPEFYAARHSTHRLRLDSDGRSIELSPVTDVGAALLNPIGRGRRRITAKLLGFASATHDEALSTLEKVVGALLFELDVMYGLRLSLMRKRPGAPRAIARDRVEHSPRFPQYDYAAEALGLYDYGRSASGLPLLEFLAYYQALEYFFPSFAHAETTRALRTTIQDPRFNAAHDADISRLISMAAPAVRAGIGEREQLKATIRASVTTHDLAEVVERVDSQFSDSLSSKKQVVRGVAPLRIRASDIREQLAERLYTIRCRIVHTKQDGGPSSEELLLPTSAEVQHLGADIAVLRFITQQAIIAQAKPA